MKPLLSITSRIFNFSISALIKKHELYSKTVRFCLHKKKMKEGVFCVRENIFISVIYCVHILRVSLENSL